MAYTFRDAIQTAYNYLNIEKEKVKIIENTNGRGIVYDFEGVKTVIFIYPISCKQNNKQNFFDTRDSGAKERATAWAYAKENGLRYFCLGFNEEQERYKDYVLSLESDENSISNISFRKAIGSEATGTQVNIPNDFIPKKNFERIRTPKGFYISAINKEYIGEYIKLFDNRPYMLDINESENEDLEARNKRLFKYWMGMQLRPAGDYDAGKPYSDSVIGEYVSNISQTPLLRMPERSVFFTTNVGEVEATLFELEGGTVNYTLQIGAVKKYIEYLKSIGDKKMVVFETKIESHYRRNRILFGAPGTGKSFTLNNERKELLGDGSDTDYERVTFHPDYSYANFVGTYKPTMVRHKCSSIVDEDKKKIAEILQNKTKTAQEKYDLLYDKFKDEGLTRLPILLGIYTDDNFKTRKKDGTDAVDDNSVERNHGRAIRQYLNLSSSNGDEKEIAYEYVPGPFIRVLVKALKSAMSNNPKPYLLIVEEINRANVAAVFGDVFQLLDRGKNGVSEYAISTSNDMRAYLAQELGVNESSVETIKIPDNMFIWATMNSADQGVFPMDTAFKRRWDFTYLGIDDAVKTFSEKIINRKYLLGTGASARLVGWNELREAINDVLSSELYNVNEDKLLGPYFISKSVLESDEDADFTDVFKNKVLTYLFDDAVKQKKKTFFEECKDEVRGVRYSEICELFDKKGVFIFPTEVSKRFSEKPNGQSVEAND